MVRLDEGARLVDERRPLSSRAWEGRKIKREMGVISDLLISGFRVEGSDRRNGGSRQLVVQKMGLATVDR
jgi:hypothetical protein